MCYWPLSSCRIVLVNNSICTISGTSYHRKEGMKLLMVVTGLSCSLWVSAESIILNSMGVFLVNPSPSDIVFPMYMISISTDTTQITTMNRSDLETKVAQGLNKCLCTRQHLMLRLDECSVVPAKTELLDAIANQYNMFCNSHHSRSELHSRSKLSAKRLMLCQSWHYTATSC
jgi:hypothetical protein